MKVLTTNLKAGDVVICVNDFTCENEAYRIKGTKLLTIKKNERYTIKQIAHSKNNRGEEVGIKILLSGKTHWFALSRFKKAELQLWFDFV